jgi:hypothetical protein
MREDVVYHFASSGNVPWILHKGALTPTMCVDVGIGRTHFLWGTTDPTGDLTAAPFRHLHGDHADDWYASEFHIVRFALPANAFLSWFEVQQFENWTSEEIAALVEADHRQYGEVDHAAWRLRRDPMPLADVVRVDTTSYADRETEIWWSLDIHDPTILLPHHRTDVLGVRIGRRQFFSLRTVTGIPGLDLVETWTVEHEIDKLIVERLEQQEEDDEEAVPLSPPSTTQTSSSRCANLRAQLDRT